MINQSAPRHRRFGFGVILAAVLAGFSCGGDIDTGLEHANDLLYQKEYIKAARLYRKLFKRLDTGPVLTQHQLDQRLVVLERLGKINALYRRDYRQAITDYQTLINLYPHTDEALAARASVADIVQHKLGDVERAIDEYQKLILDFPDRDETRWAKLQIIQGYFRLQNYKQARMEAEALNERWPDSREASQARLQIANSYYIQGRYTEAIAVYEDILKRNPAPSLSALVLFELGNCYQDIGQTQQALAYLYESLADHPNPLLVQRKIKRARRRLESTKPAQSVHMSRRKARAEAKMPGGKGPVGLSYRSLERASAKIKRKRMKRDARQEQLRPKRRRRR